MDKVKGKGKPASRAQLLTLAGLVVQHLPRELSVEQAQYWVDRPADLEWSLARVLGEPESVFPTTIRLGSRTYQLLRYPIGTISSIFDYAKEKRARPGRDDHDHTLKYQTDIPLVLRHKVWMYFTDLCFTEGRTRYIHVIYWCGIEWCSNICEVGEGFVGEGRLSEEGPHWSVLLHRVD